MLRYLRIEHLAVIDAVHVEFEPGLNVLTGETGAGKSMLVEAVGLLMGGRASADLIRTGESQAQVQAEFDVADLKVRTTAVADLKVGTTNGHTVRSADLQVGPPNGHADTVRSADLQVGPTNGHADTYVVPTFRSAQH